MILMLCFITFPQYAGATPILNHAVSNIFFVDETRYKSLKDFIIKLYQDILKARLKKFLIYKARQIIVVYYNTAGFDKP